MSCSADCSARSAQLLVQAGGHLERRSGAAGRLLDQGRYRFGQGHDSPGSPDLRLRKRGRALAIACIRPKRYRRSSCAKIVIGRRSRRFALGWHPQPGGSARSPPADTVRPRRDLPLSARDSRITPPPCPPATLRHRTSRGCAGRRPCRRSDRRGRPARGADGRGRQAWQRPRH